LLKLLIVALFATGAVYLFVLRNRKVKFEVEFEVDPSQQGADIKVESKDAS
jgi:hypothetical protein